MQQSIAKKNKHKNNPQSIIQGGLIMNIKFINQYTAEDMKRVLDMGAAGIYTDVVDKEDQY